MFKLLAALSAITAATVSAAAIQSFKLHPTSDVASIDYLRWGENSDRLNGPIGWFEGGDGTGNSKIVELFLDGAGDMLDANDTAYQAYVDAQDQAYLGGESEAAPFLSTKLTVENGYLAHNGAWENAWALCPVEFSQGLNFTLFTADTVIPDCTKTSLEVVYL